jgi:uncharacterized repeat protein (TIGR01451 family)
MRYKQWMASFVLCLIVVAGLAWGLGGDIQDTQAVTGVEESVFRLHHPFFMKEYYGYNSHIYIQNPNTDSATVNLTFYDPSGTTYSFDSTLSPKETWAISGASLAQIPEGYFGNLIISSDQVVESVNKTDKTVTNGDELTSFRAARTATTSQAFGPFYKGVSLQSGLGILNVGGTNATVSAEFFDMGGALVATENLTLLPLAQGSLFSVLLDQLPDGFQGWVHVTSDQPVVGYLQQTNTTVPEAFQTYPALTDVHMPRVLKSVDEGNGARSTTLFVGNTATTVASTTLSYLNRDGTVAYTSSLSLPALNGTVIDLENETHLADEGIWAVTLDGAASMVLGESYQGESGAVSAGTYEIPEDSYLSLPRLVKSDGEHTIFSLQRVDEGTSSVPLTIRYYNVTGTLILEDNATLAPGGWLRHDLRDLAGLGTEFRGSAIVSSSASLMALVDEYVYEPCEPVGDVQLSRQPSGDLFTGTTVRFTAGAVGSRPFTYTWTLDGSTVGADQSVYEHAFTASGTYTVGVTVHNACGQGSDAMIVDVLEPAGETPNLTLSDKSASLSHVESGDHLTYTLILRNRSAVTASTTLTDPIPAHTTYISDSAQASDGSPVTLVDDALRWAGEVISGTPVILEFAVEVQTTEVGRVITNVAHLDDGAGTVLQLEAESVYNPGYRLTIDDGALYTSIPTVALTLSWAVEEPPIENMQISNDGGFGSGTGWIGVDSNHSGWVLDTYGDLRMPRTVYALFRDTEGRQYGPIQDDIIYDPQPPSVLRVEIITQTTQAATLMNKQDVIVRVTADDDNSGIAEVQVSDTKDFSAPSNFEMIGRITDIPWTLQPSGQVHVRVVDRAGNISETKSEQGVSNYRIYLPALARAWSD